MKRKREREQLQWIKRACSADRLIAEQEGHWVLSDQNRAKHGGNQRDRCKRREQRGDVDKQNSPLGWVQPPLHNLWDPSISQIMGGKSQDKEEVKTIFVGTQTTTRQHAGNQDFFLSSVLTFFPFPSKDSTYFLENATSKINNKWINFSCTLLPFIWSTSLNKWTMRLPKRVPGTFWASRWSSL